MTTARPKLHRLAGALALVLTAFGTAATAEDSSTRLLGAGGDVLQVVTGTLDSLFGDTSEDADNPALALDVMHAESVDRLLIPGTEGPDQELTPTALFESESETLYLAWSARFNLIHDKINVIWYRDGAWSPPIELVGAAFTEKTSPRIAFTRESFELVREDGSRERHTRSIVHTLWAETNGLGLRVVYTPIVFIDGEPLGDITELTLDPELLTADADLGSNETVPFLPALGRSTSPRRLLATLSDEELLAVLSLDPVPVELTRLGDGVRASIVPIGRIVCGGSDGGAMRLASAVREEIFLEGTDLFHPSVLEHIASAAESTIVRAGDATCRENAPALADTVFEEILGAGTDALDSGRIRVGNSVRASIVPIGRSRSATGVDDLVHLLRIGRVSARRLPPLRVGRSHVMPSSDGQHLIVAWEDADGLLFQETSDDGGWNEPSNLRLDANLDLPSALQLLERRAAGR